MPSVIGYKWLHHKSPLSEAVEGGEVVFDEAKTPLAQPGDVFAHSAEHAGMGSVQSAGGEPPFIRNILAGIEKGTEPDAGLDAFLLDLPHKSGHIGELLISEIPGAAIILAVMPNLPAVIDHHKRAVYKTFGQPDQIVRVLQDLLLRTDPISIVPVITAVHGLVREPGIRTHLTAEFPGSFKSRDVMIGFIDLRRCEHPSIR